MFASPLLMLMLASGAADAGAASAAKPADPLEKVVCRREQVTGSLFDGPRICHTVREWRRMQNDAQDEAARITKPGTLNDLNG